MPKKKIDYNSEEVKKIMVELEELKKKKKFSESYPVNKKIKRQAPKKKTDSLIEEAKKIKTELDELKRKKKFSDSYLVNTATQKQTGTCKGICKKFKATRPINGKRYESGQARCQICEIWIDYRGSHTKDSLPATEDSVGWYCNCCNYRVRQKPRNKIYKEKLRESYKEIGQIISNEKRPDITLSDIKRFVNIKNMSNTQPYISVLQKFINLANQFPDESLTKKFENRFILGIKSANTVKNQRSIIQNFENFLKPQHTKMSQVISKQILDSGESTNKKQNIDEINESISEALIIIRKNSSGVYKKILEQKLMMTEEEFEKFLPKLLRIEGIVEEEDGHSNIFLKFIEKNDERVIQKQTIEQKTEYENTDWVVEKEKIQREQAPEIEKIIIQMIQNHLRWKKNINKELKRNVISEFIEVRSLEKVYEIHPSYTAERIKAHLITDLRLPKELKILENEGGLHPNLICSLAIALYATDYFHWDGKKEDEEKVTDLAISISKYLNSNNRLNNIFLDK